MLLGNGPGIPLAYVVVSVILVIFAVGYTAMARHHTSTGAFYSFVSRGLRQPAGGAAAFIALLGYNAMQIGLYGLFAAAAAGFLSENFGINWPWWVYASSPWRSLQCSATVKLIFRSRFSRSWSAWSS
jgi:L-asparagine transporter-like permease